jgi:hypothetical protein
MATRFSTVYKQELKNKGVLSSMGSAVLKSARERMDVRNIFFGGKGMLSATGQKIFGRGYSPLSSGGAGSVSSAQVSAQAAATNDLISSNERQEALLRVVAKNTFNMNLMARDMNITRQNIATLTRLAAGKSAQSQDALWYDVKTRNQAIDSLGKKGGDSKPSQTAPSSSSALGGIFGGIGSMLGGIASFGGSIISGTLGAISRISPILGIIALMAGGYVIKEISKSIDFGPLKEKIYSFLGLDIKSDKNILQQWADKLDLQFDTKKFNEIYDTVSKTIIRNFGPQIDLVGKSIATASDAVLTYAKAAFMQLAAGFSGMGGAIGFLLNEFFQSNKGKILMAIAAGLAAGSAKDPRSAALALAGIGAAGLFGAATGEKSRDELREEIDSKLKDLLLLQRRIDEAENAPNTVTGNAMRGQLPKYYEGKKAIIDKLSELGSQLSGKENQLKGYLTPNFGTFNEIIEADRPNWGKGYVPVTPQGGTAPSQIPSGGNLRDVIGRREGGRAGYDAIFGFGGPGGDPSITSKYGKPLSQLTIGEALAISDARMTGDQNAGAMGRYGFLPGTLRGALKSAGLSEKDVFSPENQDKIYQAVLNNMVSGLRAQGFTNITDDLINLAWHVGPAGAKALVDAQKNNPGAIAADILKLSPGGRKTNPSLNQSVDSLLRGRQLSQSSVDLSNGQRMAMAFDGSGITVVAPTTNVQSGGGAPQSFASATNFDAIELFASNMA